MPRARPRGIPPCRRGASPAQRGDQGGGRVEPRAGIGRRHEEEEGADHAEEPEPPGPRRGPQLAAPTTPAIDARSHLQGREQRTDDGFLDREDRLLPGEVGQQVPGGSGGRGRVDVHRLTQVSEDRADLAGLRSGRDQRRHGREGSHSPLQVGEQERADSVGRPARRPGPTPLMPCSTQRLGDRSGRSHELAPAESRSRAATPATRRDRRPPGR